MVYEFYSEPAQGEYKDLIKYACNNSDAIMLVFIMEKSNNEQYNRILSIRKTLATSRIKTRTNAQWPVTVSYDTSHDFFIDIYKPDERVYNYLLSRNSLYDWGNAGFPEDLSFFNEGKCWLATCSHEKFGWLVSEDTLPTRIMKHLQIVEHSNNIDYYEDY